MASEPILSTSTASAAPALDASAPSARSQARANWLVLLFVALLLISLSILAFTLVPNLRAQPSRSADDTALSLEQRMLIIADRMQCPICQGQSVAFSNSQLAAEMRRQILERLEAGASEQEVMQYFIDRYGIRVLREPPRTGLNLWLWITPAIGLVIGLAGLAWRLRRMAQTRRPLPDEAQAEQSVALADPDIQELLVRYDKDLFA